MRTEPPAGRSRSRHRSACWSPALEHELRHALRRVQGGSTGVAVVGGHGRISPPRARPGPAEALLLPDPRPATRTVARAARTLGVSG